MSPAVIDTAIGVILGFLVGVLTGVERDWAMAALRRPAAARGGHGRSLMNGYCVGPCPGCGRLDAIVVHLNRPEHWQDFERLCRDLLGRLFDDIHSDLHGRTGQAQDGVDLWAIDRGSGARVRAQCKALEGTGSLDEAAVRALVQEVRAGTVRPDRYMILTTAPNHAPNKTLAGELSGPDFEVQIHGWDWISGKIEEHDDLIERYKLARVIDRSARTAGSPLAREIGARLLYAVQLMNEGRDETERLSVQSIASHLALDDWGRLERIAAGEVQAPLSELRALADGMGVCEAWLIEGKHAPFRLDDPTRCTEVSALHDLLLAMEPETVWFVRKDNEDAEVTIVLERDDLRWFVWTTDFPCSERVGAGGRSQMLDLCALMRRLDMRPWPSRARLLGQHVSPDVFAALISGDRHPRSVLKWKRNDDWWEAFAALDASLVHEGEYARLVQLRRAIEITLWQLEQKQARIGDSPRWRDYCAWGFFDRLHSKTKC